MNFKESYDAQIGRSLTHLSAHPNRKYIVAGESASIAATEVMNLARIQKIEPPNFLMLDSRQSRMLYFASAGSYELIEPAIERQDSCPSILFLNFFEDFSAREAKLRFIFKAMLHEYGLFANFVVMFGRKESNLPYVEYLAIDSEMALQLDNMFP